LSRQSLRRSVADPDCDGDGNSGCKRYAYRDTYTDSNTNSDSHGYCNDASSYSDAHREGHSDTKASPDAAAKAVEIFARAKTSSD